MKCGHVYIMANHYHTVLYTGVTSNLEGRVYEHKNRIGGLFTRKYKCDRLVYFCKFSSIQSAIEFEKKIKAGPRKKKVDRIEQNNPEWLDLAAEWF